MKTFFKTISHSTEIVPVQVLSETEKTVLIPNRYGGRAPVRQHKCSNYENYFPTFQDAKAYLLERGASRYQRATEEKALAFKALQDVQLLTDPTA